MKVEAKSQILLVGHSFGSSGHVVSLEDNFLLWDGRRVHEAFGTSKVPEPFESVHEASVCTREWRFLT